MGYLNLLISIKIVISKKFEFVKLNLFNHVLVLFRAKFACNLAIRYPVFRWDLCKGCVWESMKKTQYVCTQEEPRNCLATGKSPKVAHVWSMQRSWRVTKAGALQDRTSNLARQLARDSNSRLVPVARLSHQNALFGWNMTFRIPHTHYYKYPYTHEM